MLGHLDCFFIAQTRNLSSFIISLYHLKDSHQLANYGRRTTVLDILPLIDANFCRAMLCISVACAVVWCPSVCHVCDSVETNKRNFKIFILSPLGSHTNLVFPYQTSWQYYDGDPQTGSSNAGEVGKKIADSRRIADFGIDDWWRANNN